jgi:hypothetical protein
MVLASDFSLGWQDSKSHQSAPAECDKVRLYVIQGYY